MTSCFVYCWGSRTGKGPDSSAQPAAPPKLNVPDGPDSQGRCAPSRTCSSSSKCISPLGLGLQPSGLTDFQITSIPEPDSRTSPATAYGSSSQTIPTATTSTSQLNPLAQGLESGPQYSVASGRASHDEPQGFVDPRGGSTASLAAPAPPTLQPQLQPAAPQVLGVFHELGLMVAAPPLGSQLPSPMLPPTHVTYPSQITASLPIPMPAAMAGLHPLGFTGNAASQQLLDQYPGSLPMPLPLHGQYGSLPLASQFPQQPFQPSSSTSHPDWELPFRPPPIRTTRSYPRDRPSPGAMHDLFRTGSNAQAVLSNMVGLDSPMPSTDINPFSTAYDQSYDQSTESSQRPSGTPGAGAGSGGPFQVHGEAVAAALVGYTTSGGPRRLRSRLSRVSTAEPSAGGGGGSFVLAGDFSERSSLQQPWLGPSGPSELLPALHETPVHDTELPAALGVAVASELHAALRPLMALRTEAEAAEWGSGHMALSPDSRALAYKTASDIERSDGADSTTDAIGTQQEEGEHGPPAEFGVDEDAEDEADSAWGSARQDSNVGTPHASSVGTPHASVPSTPGPGPFRPFEP